MEQKRINLTQLQDFVESHNLKNKYSVIRFKSIVTIATVENRITDQKMEVLINFDGYDCYGTVKLLHDDLDPLVYPTDFDGKWQTMRHVEGVFLMITGTHTKNLRIGSYEVKIVPVEKLTD